MDLIGQIALLDLPILWIVGKDDIHFFEKAQEIKFKHPQSKCCVFSKTGHRIPWQEPEAYFLKLKQFIENLE